MVPTLYPTSGSPEGLAATDCWVPTLELLISAFLPGSQGMLVRLVPPRSKIHSSNNSRQRDDVGVSVGLQPPSLSGPATRLACTRSPARRGKAGIPSRRRPGQTGGPETLPLALN